MRPVNGRLRAVAIPPDQAATSIAAAVRAGLGGESRSLPCHLFYDDEGSRLFEKICALDEYYATRVEAGILEASAGQIVGCMPGGTSIFELGSGSARKTEHLIGAFIHRDASVHYAAVDVSPTALAESAERLLNTYPELSITTLQSDYEAGIRQLDAVAPAPRLALWLGSNVGNQDRAAAAAFLGRLRKKMSPDDALLLGADLRKDQKTLEAAYDDSQGVTAAFNKNILARINRELGANFDLDAFRHRAVYEVERGRIQMFLVSEQDQVVAIPALGMQVTFAEGEEIHTEDSWKYSLAELETLARAAGMSLSERWTDDGERFCSVLLIPA